MKEMIDLWTWRLGGFYFKWKEDVRLSLKNIFDDGKRDLREAKDWFNWGWSLESFDFRKVVS